MSQWIPCIERIPQNDRHVLVTDNNRCFVAYFEEVDWVDADFGMALDVRVTHWTELPELPRRMARNNKQSAEVAA